MRSLLVHVSLLHPLWHGAGDWPPSPFRLFQAMVAGAFGGRWMADDESTKRQRMQAFHWLECQRPPDISAPTRWPLRQVRSFVPNNDLDSVGGDPVRVEEIRAEKVLSPVGLERSQLFLYAWHFTDGEAEAGLLCDLAERLHTFGRGIDPAWAKGQVVDRQRAEESLLAHGSVVRPTGSTGTFPLPSPVDGSLRSLLQRHRATTERLRLDANSGKTFFRQPPKANYRQVGYDRVPARWLFEIRERDNLNRFVAIPQVKASALTEAVREAAAERLRLADEKYGPMAERFIAGRGAGPSDLGRRVRIVPLPTIGHPHASPAIRRVAVEAPPECPITLPDVNWAFLGLTLPNKPGLAPFIGSGAMLVRAEADEMLRHYGSGMEAMRWRSVTPVALPMPPTRVRTGGERSVSEADCAAALAAAVRHAGVEAKIAEVRIQREPFHVKGELADAFEAERFSGRLRHVEVVFASPVTGPIVLGDGRFLGLGVMRPVKEPHPGLHVFEIENGGSLPMSRSGAIARALRRAVMARAQELFSSKPLPLIFHGHQSDGAPAREGTHEHLFYAAYSNDGSERIDRLAVIAPGLCDRSVSGRRHWDDVARAVQGLRELNCGPDGLLLLSPVFVGDDDLVFGTGCDWVAAHGYRPTRYPKKGQDLSTFVESDLRIECARRALPRPVAVQVLSTLPSRRGLSIQARVIFATPVSGPILLGQQSHFGDGLFRLSDASSDPE